MKKNDEKKEREEDSVFHDGWCVLFFVLLRNAPRASLVFVFVC